MQHASGTCRGVATAICLHRSSLHLRLLRKAHEPPPPPAVRRGVAARHAKTPPVSLFLQASGLLQRRRHPCPGRVLAPRWPHKLPRCVGWPKKCATPRVTPTPVPWPSGSTCPGVPFPSSLSLPCLRWCFNKAQQAAACLFTSEQLVWQA